MMGPGVKNVYLSIRVKSILYSILKENNSIWIYVDKAPKAYCSFEKAAGNPMNPAIKNIYLSIKEDPYIKVEFRENGLFWICSHKGGIAYCSFKKAVEKTDEQRN